ncbi:MAG: hypothetical protein R2838_24760 [Caldilineaceae bacterium]
MTSSAGSRAAEYAYNELRVRARWPPSMTAACTPTASRLAADVFADRGGEVTFQGAVNVGDTDMRPIPIEVASNPPDVLYSIFEPESTPLPPRPRRPCARRTRSS